MKTLIIVTLFALLISVSFGFGVVCHVNEDYDKNSYIYASLNEVILAFIKLNIFFIKERNN